VLLLVVDHEFLYENMYATEGSIVTIHCHSSDSKSELVLWQYRNFEELSVYDVYDGRSLISDYANKCTIDDSTYDLTIRNVEVSDAGIYWCIEDGGFGVKHITKLYITGVYQCYIAVKL